MSTLLSDTPFLLLKYLLGSLRWSDSGYTAHHSLSAFRCIIITHSNDNRAAAYHAKSAYAVLQILYTC